MGLRSPTDMVTVNAATDTIPPGTLIRTNTSPVNIGLIPASANFYYQGIMDELRILDRALTPGEILLDYGISYPATGSLTSVLVTPPTGDVWLRFDAVDSRPADTSITYSILNEAGKFCYPTSSRGQTSGRSTAPPSGCGQIWQPLILPTRLRCRAGA